MVNIIIHFSQQKKNIIVQGFPKFHNTQCKNKGSLQSFLKALDEEENKCLSTRESTG